MRPISETIRRIVSIREESIADANARFDGMQTEQASLTRKISQAQATLKIDQDPDVEDLYSQMVQRREALTGRISRGVTLTREIVLLDRFPIRRSEVPVVEARR